MGIKHDVPKVPSPLRVMIKFESTGWFDTTAEERTETILPNLNAAIESWKELGAELIGTIDRDIFTAGLAGDEGWHAVLLYNVPDLQGVTAMTHSFRASGLDKYFRLEAIVGRPFFLLEK